jgi:2-methylaconitate cis-trans-isomerase PrpF
VPNESLPEREVSQSFVFGHPGGTMPMEADVMLNENCNEISFRRLGFGRTARKIADCAVYVKPSHMDSIQVRVVPPICMPKDGEG